MTHQCRDCAKKTADDWCLQWHREVDDWSIDRQHSWHCYQPCAGGPTPNNNRPVEDAWKK
ncbi:MAG: hypothetical protein NTY03_01265 [Candidatus Bathyarchaeota archaeon]|nr:hypothetical protein [Candidatus Bathyarchaeota archaeon]